MIVECSQLLIPLLKHFDKHGGYWDINKSEGNNIEIKWCPFIGDKRGGYVQDIFMKRCYSLVDYVEFMNQILIESGNPDCVMVIDE